VIGYLDCFSGISGNMLLAALVHAGLPEDILRRELALLKVPAWRLELQEVKQGGIEAKLLTVHCAKQEQGRHLADIESLLKCSDLAPKLIQSALAVFRRLAQAEGRVHGISPEQVHFHEVGALDAIIDIVGVVIGLDYLGIQELICSPLPLSRGWVHCQHGSLPLPAPAVCELLQGVPVEGLSVPQELVTPTGAALAVVLSSSFGPLPSMQIQGIGYGAGSRQRQDGRPNLLRLFLGQRQQVEEAQQVEQIETHLDDWNPELWPHIAERLLAAGALDVCLIPMQMKKGRPGFLLRILAEPAQASQVKDCLLCETTAIGLRFQTMQRLTLPRRTLTLSSPWGDVAAKEVVLPNGKVRVKAEYEDCVRLAREQGLSLHELYSHLNTAPEFFPNTKDHG
jgi:pyridinium-3,5-bisthiocarboxylic acid mononucleotide nickel chelatase